MKNFAVVGGTSGIGKATALDLAKAGNNVFVYARNPASDLQHENITFHSLDVTSEELAMNLPDELHGLVYAPGSINLKPFHRLKQKDFESDYTINVLGAVRVIQHALEALKQGNGSVVLFSTVAAKTGMPFHASIAAAKSAIEGLAKSLAAEYAPVLRFNVIAPSLTDTPLAERLLNNEQKRSAANERHPLKKVGSPSDLAALAVFLLSDQAQFMTGQVIGVEGGIGSLKIG